MCSWKGCGLSRAGGNEGFDGIFLLDSISDSNWTLKQKTIAIRACEKLSN